MRMSTEGVYVFTAEVIDPQDDGYYTDTVAIGVHDRDALDALLRTKWEGMKEALGGQDISRALNFYTISKVELYQEVFTVLFDRLPEIAQNMEDIQLIYSRDNLAKYRIRKTEPYGSQTVRTTYYIYFVVDRDGIWKIHIF